jgi:peptide/nickel transport system permease protein
MKTYLIKRLLSVIPVLFIVSTIVFLILQLTPGDPALVILGQEATIDEVEDMREQLGLNRPMY